MLSPESTTNIIPFPTRSLHNISPDLPVMTTRTTALDVCYSVYGESLVSVDTIDNYYETNASELP